jgi:DNA polymerase III subunit gamma/tau
VVIYRKYRPRSFAEVEGQDTNISILKTSISRGNLSHAILLVGSRGTGKTTTARLVAKALNCLNFAKQQDVCNECSNCLEFEQGRALNITEIDAASNRGIEDIRSLKEGVNFAPTSGVKKVYIIDEVHMLTKEAFNALLKTLEEPPAHAVFILATTEPHRLPITILSRVQRYNFKLANKEEMTRRLEKIFALEGLSAEPEVFELIYGYSGGSYRDAESVLTKLIGLPDTAKQLTANNLQTALGLSSTQLITEIADYLKSGKSLPTDKSEELRLLGYDFGSFCAELLDVLKYQYRASVDQNTLRALKQCLKVLNEYGTDLDLLIGIAILFEGASEEIASPSVTPPAPTITPVDDASDKDRNAIPIKQKISLTRRGINPLNNKPSAKAIGDDKIAALISPIVPQNDNSELINNLLLS